jgi:hypothetical protein
MNRKTMTKKNGKNSPSNEKNHHSEGCRYALRQARIYRITIPILTIIRMRLPSVRTKRAIS